jgi:predicted nucleotidyltransferase
MAPPQSKDIAKIEAITSPIFENSKCDFVYLGGSVAEGTSGWWSDIDFFVHATFLKEKDEKSRFKWLTDLTLWIVKELETDDVHVSILADLPLNVQYNVVSKGKVLFEGDGGTLRGDYIEWMLPRYYDFKIWYERMINEWVY